MYVLENAMLFIPIKDAHEILFSGWSSLFSALQYTKALWAQDTMFFGTTEYFYTGGGIFAASRSMELCTVWTLQQGWCWGQCLVT